jgi:hypothetical protein
MIELLDASGRVVRVGGAGEPRVLALVGTLPPDAPPPSPAIERMLELPNRLPGETVVLIAAPLTPGPTTPTAEMFFAMGPSPAIRELALELGVVIAREPHGWIAGHAVVVVDRDGRIAKVFRGLTEWSAADLARAVAQAAGR